MLSSDRISASVCEGGFLEKSSPNSQSTPRQRVTELPGKPVLDHQNGDSHLSSANGRANGHLRTDSESIPDIYRRYVPKFPIMWSTRYRTVTCMLAGAVFGLAMEKGRGKDAHQQHFFNWKRKRVEILPSKEFLIKITPNEWITWQITTQKGEHDSKKSEIPPVHGHLWNW